MKREEWNKKFADEWSRRANVPITKGLEVARKADKLFDEGKLPEDSAHATPLRWVGK